MRLRRRGSHLAHRTGVEQLRADNSYLASLAGGDRTG